MNTIFVSSLLKSKFPETYEDLYFTLSDEENIELKYLDNTNDVWVRDFMPIKTYSGKYVQYIYNPNYLKDDSHKNLKTEVSKVIPQEIKNKILHTDIVLDGGNFVSHNKKAIMTDKIYTENPTYNKDDLDNKIKNLFELDDLIIIPKQPYDIFGHSDSMVRWINDNNVLVNDFQIESKSFNSKLIKSLEKHNLGLELIDYGKNYFHNNRKWSPNLNFLKIGNIILIPLNTLDGMEMFYEKIEKLFPSVQIYFINCEKLISEGGALHCITWNL